MGGLSSGRNPLKNKSVIIENPVDLEALIWYLKVQL